MAYNVATDGFIQNQVNPSVLGGIIVDFGDKTIDLSVSTRVTKLNNILQREFSSPPFT
jgi:F0F1-type ATP synthase delta subunit